MYILTIDGKEEEGAYSVVNEDGEQILYMFEEEDDATRFAMMLEDMEYPQMNVTEVDDNLLIMACDHHGYKYAVFTPNDIVIPPDESEQDDFI
jgi:hypothetical protein